MKYAVFLAFLSAGELLFVRQHNPTLWNQTIRSFQVDESTYVHQTFIPPNPLPAQAHWTWTTTDGKTYHDVVIKQVDADCVTFLDADGGARVDISTLPVDVQELLNYNPELAAKAREDRNQDEESSATALAQEQVAADQINQKKLILAAQDIDRAQQAVSMNQNIRTTGTDTFASNPEYARYSQDLATVSEYVIVDPVTGFVKGDERYVKRYEEDRRLMELFRREHSDSFAPRWNNYQPNNNPLYNPANHSQLEPRSNSASPMVHSAPQNQLPPRPPLAPTPIPQH